MRNDIRDKRMKEYPLNSLSEAPAGQRLLVRQLSGGKDFVSRMTALGFTEGVEVQVIQNYGRGPLITLVRGVRVALGRGEASKVLIEEIRDEPGAGNYASN
jgi:ferrous iron transport protein A